LYLFGAPLALQIEKLLLLDRPKSLFGNEFVAERLRVFIAEEFFSTNHIQGLAFGVMTDETFNRGRIELVEEFPENRIAFKVLFRLVADELSLNFFVEFVLYGL
jgi:hypothetical protein